MTAPRQNDIPDRVRTAEQTLRLIATVPAPEGLAERVQARLSAAPRRSFLTGWSGFGRNGWMYSPALRGCAATAIVLLVAGGGWHIYSRVQPPTSAGNNVILMSAPHGFSPAGNMHKPDTLNGPVLVHPAVPVQQNVVAPIPSAEPQTVTPQAQPVPHKKKHAAAR